MKIHLFRLSCFSLLFLDQWPQFIFVLLFSALFSLRKYVRQRGISPERIQDTTQRGADQTRISRRRRQSAFRRFSPQLHFRLALCSFYYDLKEKRWCLLHYFFILSFESFPLIFLLLLILHLPAFLFHTGAGVESPLSMSHFSLFFSSGRLLDGTFAACFGVESPLSLYLISLFLPRLPRVWVFHPLCPWRIYPPRTMG